MHHVMISKHTFSQVNISATIGGGGIMTLFLCASVNLLC